MARIDHHAILRRHLRRGERLTFEDILTMLGVGERQARRILRALNEEGPPLLEEREGTHKVFYYAPEHLAGDSFQVELSEEEALALAFAAEAARMALEPTHLAEPLAAAARRLFDAAEVLTFEPEETSSLVRFAGETGAPVERDVFRAVWDGVCGRMGLRVTYENARGERSVDRRIDPFALVVVRGSWTLVAFDHKRKQISHFSLPAIEAAELDAAHDGPPAGFDVEQHLRDAFGGFAADGATVETIRLHVDPAAVSSFRRKYYHPTQMIEQELDDGSVMVSFEAALAPDLEAFVRSFGPAVHVLEPAALADAVAAAAARVVTLYASDR